MPSSKEQTKLKHLGVILDGNRRWAKSQGIDKLEGHLRGYENFQTIAEAAIDRGVEFISAYVFSTENWNRPEEEVSYLMDLLYKVATTKVAEVHEKDIRVRFLGSKDNLRPEIVEAIDAAEAKTAENGRGTIAFCLNYGGQKEIVDAVRSLIEENEDIGPGDITKEAITGHLYEPDIPPVDLVLRTSGEQRISNFMLWRVAYAEFMFVKKHWPEFSEEDLDTALNDYAGRQRRFGA